MSSSHTSVRLLALIACLVGGCTVVVGSGEAASRVSPSPCGRNHAPLAVYFAGMQVDSFSLSQAFTVCSLGRNHPLVSYNYGPCPNRVLEPGPQPPAPPIPGLAGGGTLDAPPASPVRPPSWAAPGERQLSVFEA